MNDSPCTVSGSGRRGCAHGRAGAEAVEDPSVITLNAISTSLATTDFLMMITGLLNATAPLEHQVY